MRIVLTFLLGLLPIGPVLGQGVDSIYVEREANVRERNNLSSDVITELSTGATAAVVDSSSTYYRVERDSLDGWIKKVYVKPLAKLRAEQQAERRREQRAREVKQRLRQQGYTVIIAAQSFSRGSAGGIDVGLGLINISESKTVKYATATWQLFNTVGDPAKKGLESSVAETRFVGPLKPGEVGRSTFEDVWYSEVGSCAELKKLVVEHIDGSSFTYVNDLADIAQLSESVRLRGDCSYEAQQKRQ